MFSMIWMKAANLCHVDSGMFYNDFDRCKLHLSSAKLFDYYPYLSLLAYLLHRFFEFQWPFFLQWHKISKNARCNLHLSLPKLVIQHVSELVGIWPVIFRYFEPVLGPSLSVQIKKYLKLFTNFPSSSVFSLKEAGGMS